MSYEKSRSKLQLSASASTVRYLLGCLAVFAAALLADGVRNGVGRAAEPNHAPDPTPGSPAHRPGPTEPVDRSPRDLAISQDGRWVLTANETSGTISLIDWDQGTVEDEVQIGGRPVRILFLPGQREALALAAEGTESGGELVRIALDTNEKSPDPRLRVVDRLALAYHPRGLAITPDGRRAYVSLHAAHQVVEVDLVGWCIAERIPVGRFPGPLAIHPAGDRLAIGSMGERGIQVVDLRSRRVAFAERFLGINFGQMETSRDGRFVYFPWMVYVQFGTTPSNIQQGWVLASRLGRVRLEEHARREAISLDPRGEAVADPFGIALSQDERRIVLTSSGTDELLVYRLPDLPFVAYGGPGDHIDPGLLNTPERFRRIPLAGRPMAVRFRPGTEQVLVASYFGNAIVEVDLETGLEVGRVELGSAPETAERRGARIFFDARFSLDQWYSCHSCHQNGGSNAVAMDTLNDGSYGTFRTVLSLWNVTETGPWTWHGWQTRLEDAVATSITETMQGKEPNAGAVADVIAYLKTLRPPVNPFRTDPTRAEAIARGRAVFESDRAGCLRCHHGPFWTDGEVHDVGLDEPNQTYPGFHTPSLTGVYARPLLLHDGRSRSLEDVLRIHHNPKDVTGEGELMEAELADLIAFLESL